MSKHTQRPWKQTGRNIRSASGLLIANVSMPTEADKIESIANARRIVACVNACDGIGTEEVEQINVKRNMRVAAIEYAALETSHTALLAALREIDETPQTDAIKSTIRAAIAKDQS